MAYLGIDVDYIEILFTLQGEDNQAPRESCKVIPKLKKRDQCLQYVCVCVCVMMCVYVVGAVISTHLKVY